MTDTDTSPSSEVGQDATTNDSGPHSITSIAVFGIGYVGTVTAAILADYGFDVTAVDIDAMKIEQLDGGESPIVEAQTEALVEQGVAAGRLSATTDGIAAAQDADVSFVCTGTPVDHDGTVDISSVLAVADQVGRALRETDDYHAIVVRSTVPPGTANSVTKRVAEASGREPGSEFGVVVNPEFLREGSAVKDFFDPPVIVIGSEHTRAVETLRDVYRTLKLDDAPFEVVEPGVAEMIKYVNNTFHALKVTFANEVGRVCHQFGVDGTKVMDIFCHDTKLNLSPYYLRPGFSFGGSCLPKDTRALATFGNRAETELIDAILPANEAHTEAAARRIRERDPDTVGILGLSFKSGTNDMRHSPAVALVRSLLDNGREVIAYDSDITTSNLIGSNRSFVERKLPEVDELLVEAPENLFTRADLVVVCTDNHSFGDLLDGSNVAVYDLVGTLRDRRNDFQDYESLC